MSNVRCNKCGQEWDASKIPLCPRCVSNKWIDREDFIKDKHHPKSLGQLYSTFRSVLSENIIDNLENFAFDIASNGTVFIDINHNNYCYCSNKPFGMIAGSAVPKNSPLPTYAMSYIYVADAFGHAHAYPEDNDKFLHKVERGDFFVLPKCAQEGCDNQVVPGKKQCNIHTQE